MARDWIERRNGKFDMQAMLFSQAISANYADYQISPADAALLAADYADFHAALLTTNDPRTRTSPAISLRDRLREQLVARMRDLGGRVRANGSISASLKQILGVGQAQPAQHALHGRPTTRPRVYVQSVVNNRLRLKVLDPEQPTLRGKPPQYVAAELFACFGQKNAPTHSDEWRFMGLALSASATIKLPQLDPGTKIWLCARWRNTHGTGPTSEAVSTHIAAMTVAPPSLMAA
jgi:hypothetical protein